MRWDAYRTGVSIIVVVHAMGALLDGPAWWMLGDLLGLAYVLADGFARLEA
jgi:hypothetical protein